MEKTNIADDSNSQPQIFVVDDDADLRAIFGEILRGAGFSVADAPNGQAALDHLVAAATLPALILLDIHMPVMSGTEMIGALRRDLRLSAIPVLILTSSRQPEDWPKEGTVGRVIKPCGVQALLTAVRQHIGRP